MSPRVFPPADYSDFDFFSYQYTSDALVFCAWPEDYWPYDYSIVGATSYASLWDRVWCFCRSTVFGRDLHTVHIFVQLQ